MQLSIGHSLARLTTHSRPNSQLILDPIEMYNKRNNSVLLPLIALMFCSAASFEVTVAQTVSNKSKPRIPNVGKFKIPSSLFGVPESRKPKSDDSALAKESIPSEDTARRTPNNQLKAALSQALSAKKTGDLPAQAKRSVVQAVVQEEKSPNEPSPKVQTTSAYEIPPSSLPRKMDPAATPVAAVQVKSNNKVPAKTASAKLNTKQSKDPDDHKPVLAGQPKVGDRWDHSDPCVDDGSFLVPVEEGDFKQDPVGIDYYEPYAEMEVYEGKQLNCNRRPLVELGRPYYQLGELPLGSNILGGSNVISPQFTVFGDMRTAVANNTNIAGDNKTIIASRLNLDIDLRLTATERFHAFVQPLERGGQFTRVEIDGGKFTSIEELDFEFDTGYFEGDLGAMFGGLVGEVLPFELPFAVGQIPLLFQNGIWMEDAVLGAAATIPGRNGQFFDISRWETTFFWGFDNINSPAFQGDDDAAKMYGVTSFVEAYGGLWELGYAFLEDRTAFDRSYHNMGISFTRRYGTFLSNSVRVIANAGQNAQGTANTADGVLLLVENSLITKYPYTRLPYFNFFAGFGNPQSAARVGSGVLRNTGILFESDALTGYPTLNDAANDTWGMAVGLNLLSPGFDQQLIVEGAMVDNFGDSIAGNQYGVGMRYQIPLTNSMILRMDAMHGFFDNAPDVTGGRVEIRHKF